MREVRGSRAGVSWRPRRGAALGLRILAVGTPLFAACAVAVILTYIVAPPVHGAALWAWRGFVAAVGTGVSVVVERRLRSVVSLSTLLKLSLLFPDSAPSRYSIALRTRTPHQLRRELLASTEPPEAQGAAVRLLELVAALNVHDRLTRGHSERVRAYARLIGMELQLSPQDVERLNWAALLHDVGKLDVSPETLSERGKLTAEQWTEIKQHPEAGARLAAPLRGWLGEWANAIRDHHERWEGGGYPDGIAGSHISIAGRIVAVADAFDVMTSARSYQRPRSAAAAREELLRCSGTQFDPNIVRAFLNVSVGRLRLLIGPLSWIAQLPILNRLPVGLAAANPVAAVVTAAVLTAGSMLGFLGVPGDSDETAAQSSALHSPATDPAVSGATGPGDASESAAAVVAVTSTTTAAQASDMPAVPTEPSDALSPTSTATTSAPPTPTTATSPVEALVAGDDHAKLASKGTVVIPIRSNDRDPAGHAFEVASTSTPSHGTVEVLGNGSLRYTSTAPATSDTFTYTIRCSEGGTATATVTVLN